jgi:Holliday junction resolvasome RuvABC endonuclease subunit
MSDEVVIGLDLGTKTGWSVLDYSGNRLASGHWNFQPKRFESGGMRYIRFRAALRELIRAWPNSAVGFEAVRRHRGVAAAHVYGGLMATMQSLLDDKEHKIPYLGIGVGTIKKHATGKGNAKKDMMIASAEERWGTDTWTCKSDDEADALWVASAYLEELK